MIDGLTTTTRRRRRFFSLFFSRIVEEAELPMFPASFVLFNLTMSVSINVTDSFFSPPSSSSTLISFLIGICVSLIALLTAFGNLVVILAFYSEKNLRTINGSFVRFFRLSISEKNRVWSTSRLFHFKYVHCGFPRRFLLHSILHSIQVIPVETPRKKRENRIDFF